MDGLTASFAGAVGPLFATDANDLGIVDLFDIYLDALPIPLRQEHMCSACRRFMLHYGHLVTIDDAGQQHAVMWKPAGVLWPYRAAFEALKRAVEGARVTSVFHASETTWGTPLTGNWSHMAVEPPAALVYRAGALTAPQAMAVSRENVRNVAAALKDFTRPMLAEALRVLEADALERAEKFVGPVRWLLDLQARPQNRNGENLLWRAIATAPEGFCHPRASVIATLLEDIAAARPFADVRRRWRAKVGPLQLQRPKAPPKAGNVEAAEKLFARLGLAASLNRRYARLDEVRATWWPQAARASHGADSGSQKGVFGHLATAAPRDPPPHPVQLPRQTLTWVKFEATVLPGIDRLDVLVPRTQGPFVALTTAADPEAPPIIAWDHADERNPVAWYVYPKGSAPQQWGLEPGWARVDAVAPFPNLWGSRPMPFLSEGVVLVVHGARDQNDAGNCLFPEMLKGELHGVRAVIEAYAKSAKLAGRAEASACGIDVRRNGSATCVLRALTQNAWAEYLIDRWD